MQGNKLGLYYKGRDGYDVSALYGYFVKAQNIPKIPCVSFAYLGSLTYGEGSDGHVVQAAK